MLVYLLHRALEAASHLGGEDLEPFYALLEGGRYGDFYAEMEQYFYYAQIKRYVYVECTCTLYGECFILHAEVFDQSTAIQLK